MFTKLANVTVPVKDYDDAIKWYTEVLGLELRMDGSIGENYRFVVVGVKGQNDVSIVLHRADGDLGKAQDRLHGLLFHTDDCPKDVADLRAQAVTITLEPEEQMWGVQTVFEDLYGNSHVILQPAPMG